MTESGNGTRSVDGTPFLSFNATGACVVYNGHYAQKFSVKMIFVRARMADIALRSDFPESFSAIPVLRNVMGRLRLYANLSLRPCILYANRCKGSMYMMSRMVLVCPLYFPDRPSDLRIHQEGLSSSPLLTAIHRVTRHGLAKVDSRVEMNGVYASDMRLFCSEHPDKTCACC